MRPVSVKFLPVQMPSSSGLTTSSETADSSKAFGVRVEKVTAPATDREQKIKLIEAAAANIKYKQTNNVVVNDRLTYLSAYIFGLQACGDIPR